MNSITIDLPERTLCLTEEEARIVWLRLSLHFALTAHEPHTYNHPPQIALRVTHPEVARPMEIYGRAAAHA